MVYGEIYATGSFTTTLGTGTGSQPWVALSSANLVSGDLSSDVINNTGTFTVSSQTYSINYQFVATIACYKGEATSNGIDIGLSIDGVDPVTGLYTSIPTAGFSTSQRELTVSGIFGLSSGTSHTVRLMVRQSGGGAAGANTIVFPTVNYSIRAINVINTTPGPTGPAGTPSVYRFGGGAVSPTNINTYYIGGITDLAISSTNVTYRQIQSLHTGSVTEVSILRYPSGTVGTSESSTFSMVNVTQSTSSVISNAVQTNNTNGLWNNYTLASPLAVTSGDLLQITWLTPTWVTPPTSVRILAHVKIV